MPADFTACVRKGGRVRTITINKKTGGRVTMPVCWDSKGRSHAGHIRHPTTPKSRGRAASAFTRQQRRSKK